MNGRVDPITAELIRDAFLSTVREMHAALSRAACSPMIYEGKECAVALFDEHGDVIAQDGDAALGPGHLALCVKATADQYRGGNSFLPGDVYYTNDACLAGRDRNDTTILAPIFWKDRLIGFAASLAHWLDVGEPPSGATAAPGIIYQDGTRWGAKRSARTENHGKTFWRSCGATVRLATS